MDMFSIAAELAATMSSVTSQKDLATALAEISERMGVRYFALSQHVDFTAAPNALRIHNYPAGWQDWYDERRLGVSDPIHRASHRTAAGFYWRDVEQLVRLSRDDRRLLGLGREIGLGDGITVPANVPGEALGSCTFVAEAGRPLPDNALIWGQTVGIFAFEVARRLEQRAKNLPFPQISDRQRQCIALSGRGLTDKLIGRALGIGHQTVLEHMREARAKLGAKNRAQLVIRVLAAGDLCMEDYQPWLWL